MRKEDKILNVKYSILQFGYWMDYLIISSFGSVLLLGRGFKPTEIGYVTTVGAILTILLQTALSSLADSSDKLTVKHVLLALFAGSATVAAVMYAIPNAYAVSFICMFTALSLVNTLSPFLVSFCLKYNAAGRALNFGIARSIGSLGYSLFGFAIGSFTEAFGTEACLPVFSAISVLLLILVSFMGNPEKKSGRGAEGKPEEKPSSSSLIRFFIRYPKYDLFLVSVMLLFFMQMITNTYMIYFVEYYGGGKSEMGLVLSVCAFAEVPAIALGSFFMKRFRKEAMLRFSSLGGLVKFASMLFIPNIKWFIAIQLLHFFYSGLYMVASVYYANSLVDQSDSVKAQGILAVGCTGIAGTVANLVGGFMLEHTTIQNIMMMGAATSFVSAVIMFIATADMKPHRQ